jgi:hypothetical protein
MKIIYRRRGASWRNKLLCVTHTERPVDRQRCSLNFLEKRYASPQRLPPRLPFDELLPAWRHSTHTGDATVWDFPGDDFTRPRLLAHLHPTEPGHKLQDVLWHQGRLWVLGVDRLDVYDADLAHTARITDPWLSGGHTVTADGHGRLLVSCSASDAVLVIDERSHEVVHALRLPEELYGVNYPLARGDSVTDHYIPNDLQLTHLNCASPWRGGIVVSTLIQGAIGWFDPAQQYHELLRGFVGCHGVRAEAGTDQLYFCDSCLGALVFWTSQRGIHSRLAADSAWLHDAQQLEGELFALSVADRNQVELVLTRRREVLTVLPGRDFGQGTQFLHYSQ